MNVALLETIDRKRKELDALLPMSPENEARLDRKFRLEFNYNSNHIEGNTLTYGETKMLLLYNEVTGKHTYRELEEMKASDLALKTIREYAADKNYPLTESTIRELNKILLVEPYWKEAITADGQPTKVEIIPGNYKQQANGVKLENGEFIAFASPQETLIKMPELVSWFREEEEKKELPLVVLAATLHHQFVSIHPFDDGNGRISRLLTNYVFYKNNLPPVVIKSADKENYLRALRAADSGNLDAFIDYIAEQLIWSLDLAIHCAQGEEVEEVDDWKKQLKILMKGLDHRKELLRKSASAIDSIVFESIIPLISLVDYSFIDAKNLFSDYFIWYGYDGSKIRYRSLPDLIQRAKEIKPYSKIDFGVSFTDFKKNGDQPFNVEFKLSCIFNDFYYSIFWENPTDSTIKNRKLLIEDEYGNTKLSTQQKQQIVSILGKRLVEIVEKKTNK